MHTADKPDVSTTIDTLRPDPQNRRTHNARNLDMVADALREVGAARSVVVDEHDIVLAGNGVREAAPKAGITKVRIVEADGDELIAVRRRGLTDAQKRALALYDNRAAELAEWNFEQLAADRAAGLDLKPFWTDKELGALLKQQGRSGKTDPDTIPELRRTSIVAGTVLELGRHRLLCGDSTQAGALADVAGDRRFALVHADPPYGMGKERDGVANDNLYDEKLDAFQMAWWIAWSPLVQVQASAYIWGNAPELWRLWYRGGLRDEPGLTIRNEIVWLKPNASGMSSDVAHSYANATERCLFIMRGQQFLGNINTADYWEGYEPLRTWLESERDRAGWTSADVNRLTKTNMAQHWFTRAQFTPIPEHQYRILQDAAAGKAFVDPFDDVFARFFPDIFTPGGDPAQQRRTLAARPRAGRTFFNNTHEAMTDVWEFGRVLGDERFGHATPKPVAMVRRAILSSSDVGADVAVPFGGTGPEIIAAEQLDRRACVVELEPQYCQVIVDRWEAFTGSKARKVGEIAA